MKRILKAIVLMLMFTTLMLSITACGDPIKDAEAAVKREFEDLKSNNEDYVKNNYDEDSLSIFGLEGVDKEQVNEYFKTIMDNLSYEIVSSEKVDDKTIIVSTNISSINMESVMEKFMENITAFASTEEAINISEEDAYKKSIELLLKSLKESEKEIIKIPVDITVSKTKNGWAAQFDENIGSAIYGGINDLDM